ncbi:MAG TPA: TonB-dependent receptor [Dyadobacter sp.]|nr:TonB-dependent receptor [Dyadobacter sp.]
MPESSIKKMIFKIMKISLIQLFTIITLTGIGYARNGAAQDLLAKRINISVTNGSFKDVLRSIESQVDITFSYQRDVVPEERLTISYENLPLDAVFAQLLTPRQIGYEVLKNRKILLTKLKAAGVETPPDQVRQPEKVSERMLSGRVTDETGAGLPGVNIVVKGTVTGTSSDMSGKYILSIPDELSGDTLVFSYIGYVNQEIQISTRSEVNVTMLADTKALTEVVVVGYGTQKKSDLTGSVVRADIQAFRESPNVNLAQSLQGSVPGLNVGQVTAAGANPTISIRGRTTINGNQNVLLVVDGIIFTGSMSDLNPADIESVDVLKDPSSMAIYGAQAANGVILITTKGGQKTSKPVFSYTGTYTTQSPVNSLHLFDREGYIKKVMDQDWKNAYLAPDYTMPNPNYNIQNYIADPPVREGFNNGTNFDWWDQTTSPGYITAHNLSVQGTSKELSYFLSGGYTDQKGFVMNDKFKRITTRINVENKISKWFKVGVQSSGSFSDYSGVAPALGGIRLMAPLVTPRDENGEFILNPIGTNVANPFLVADADDFDKRNSLFGNLYAGVDVPFVPGLTYRLNYGHNFSWDRHYSSNPYLNGASGTAYKINSTSYDWTLDNIINYKTSFNKAHSLDVTLVAGRRERNFEESNATGYNYNSLRLSYNDLSLATVQNIFSSAWNESFLYQMARVNYELKYRYLLTATIRRDGFSGFAENKKTALFPSIGFGWVISEEEFIKPLDITMLKLRGSYGRNGNLVDRYSSLARMHIYPAYVFGEGAPTEFGQQVTSLANPNLSWETTTGFNFGLDFAVLKNRLSGSLDYYLTTTSDLIFDVNIPEVTGFSQITSNIGNIANRGIELMLNGKAITGQDLKWNVSFNLAANRNRIMKLLGQDNNGDGVEDDLVASGLFIGQPIGAIYDYESGGIIQLNEEPPKGFFVGTHRIVDQNNDGFIDANDRVIRGRTEPAFNFGLLNEFQYKNFTFRFFLNSIQGGRNSYLGLNMPTAMGIGDNARRHNFWRELDYWTPANPNARYRSLDQGAATEYNYYGNRSFVRLQDITLSYSVGAAAIQKLGLQGLKLFVSGKNLATWTKWQGWDPESGAGLSSTGMPVMKGFSVGLDVRF